MFSGDVARDDRLRLEDRIDENVVAHDPLVPRGVNGPRTATAPRHASSYHTAFAQRVLTPSVVGARRRVTAEPDVEAGAHDALCLVDIDECGTQADDLRRERNLAGAEIVIVIFNEAGEDVGEGVFTADADGPSRACLARGIGSSEDDRGRPIIVALPGAATSRSSSKPGRPAAVPYRVEGACRPRSPGSPAQPARPLRTGISASPRPRDEGGSMQRVGVEHCS